MIFYVAIYIAGVVLAAIQLGRKGHIDDGNAMWLPLIWPLIAPLLFVYGFMRVGKWMRDL